MRRTLVLLLLATVCGALASWIAYKQVTLPKPEQTGPKTVPVVVAAFDMPYGDAVEATKLKLVAWPEESLPEGAYTKFEDAIGKLATTQIMKGEPITDRRVADNLGGSALANLIEKDKRAMTVRVNDVIGVGGFLLPGNRVDVLATRRVRGDDGGQRAETRTILKNLKVLAVDQQARTDKDDPVVVRAVTVEVDPKQAEMLTAATQEGPVQLVLRNPMDADLAAEPEPEPPPPVAVKRKTEPKKVVVAPPPPPPPEPVEDPYTTPVTVIRGTSEGTSKAQK